MTHEKDCKTLCSLNTHSFVAPSKLFHKSTYNLWQLNNLKYYGFNNS
jgi:hypothetical protein